MELEAIIYALEMSRHYLMGNEFELRIDHHTLKYVFEQPHLNARNSIYIEF